MSADMNDFSTGLERNVANYVALTPIQFLERTARAFPERIAVRHGEIATSYRQFDTPLRHEDRNHNIPLRGRYGETPKPGSVD